MRFAFDGGQGVGAWILSPLAARVHQVCMWGQRKFERL